MKISTLFIILIWTGVLFFLGLSTSVMAKECRDSSNVSPLPMMTPGNSENQTLDSLYSLYQPYLKNISAYEPIYFLVGTDPAKSRFQFSFKYRFLNPDLQIVKKFRWIQGFHLAYTQTSFWDLKASSQPFKDTSYKPEVFFLTPNLLPQKFDSTKLFFQAGYQHESNGRDEDYSRSTNYLYATPIFIYYHEKSQLGLQLSPKIWTYVGNDNDTNPDLYKYRGYFNLEIKAGMANSFVLMGHFRHAEKGISIRLDLTYPLSNIFRNIDLYFQVQYVNALAESLIDYKKRIRALRFGFAIVR